MAKPVSYDNLKLTIKSFNELPDFPRGSDPNKAREHVVQGVLLMLEKPELKITREQLGVKFRHVYHYSGLSNIIRKVSEATGTKLPERIVVNKYPEIVTKIIEAGAEKAIKSGQVINKHAIQRALKRKGFNVSKHVITNRLNIMQGSGRLPHDVKFYNTQGYLSKRTRRRHPM